MGALKILGILTLIVLVIAIAGGYYVLHLLQTGFNVNVNLVQAGNLGQYFNVTQANETSLLSGGSVPASP